ncbi:cullin-4B [Trypanosoma rangeli]|uniref:Cullin-4B n=1 Tax=Trypanosoma rangeli TaxID=5698 RepID=A0A3R7MYJ4_TRYRA|nr:cullin-4B [Trypanosoma rangeli]RNE97244.1 cullin-4B [Trypanosoma rangeli]|eukprot:RNE97244.1 cullin-4B [Trypanosoma rangeli]
MPVEACGDVEEATTGARPCEEVVATRLREAYAALDRASFDASGVQALSPRIPCASSLLETLPCLRELCTVTLNLEVLLRCRNENALYAVREKYLRCHRYIFHTLNGVHDIHGFLRYWVRGVVAYEFCEMQRYMDGGCCDDAEARDGEQGGVERAIEHAVELREALHRLPKLVAFLFPVNSRQAEMRGGGDVMNEEVRHILNEPTKQQVLRRLLMEVLQSRREWKFGVPSCEAVGAVRHGCPNTNAQLHDLQGPKKRLRQMPTNFAVAIAELLQLQPQPARGAERLLVTTVLQSVVQGCRSFFPREALLSLLHFHTCEEARHVFLVKMWPQYWNSELAMTRELPGVVEEGVKGLLTKLVFLWEAGIDAPVHGPLNTVSGLQHCYVFHLLRVTLRPLLEELFALDATFKESATRGPLMVLLGIAQGMACVETPSQGAPQLWEQAGAGTVLLGEFPREVGYVAMAEVCRGLLEARLTAAVEHFLGSGDLTEEQRGPRLLAYLLRTERVFCLLCEAQSLGARMRDDGGAMACFYSIVKHAVANHPHRSRGADVFADTLLESMQTYLLQRGRERAAGAALLLRNEDEFLSAVRLTQSVISTDRYLRVYKELLAYRLLYYTVSRARDDGLDAAEARREKVQAEKAACEHLQELFPLECDTVRQMVQMCLDMEAGEEAQAGHDPLAPQDEQGGASEEVAVRPMLWLLSRRAWPSYPVLEDAPQPLLRAMRQFARVYHAQHRGRRIVWLRTSMETITFTVGYPQATKLIVGSLELFNIFHCLSEAGAAGAPWTLLAQRIGKGKTMLQRGLKKLLNDGFFTVQADAEEECVALNAIFTSHRPRYHFLQQPPRVGALSEVPRTIMEEAHLSHTGAIMASVIKHMKRVRACMYDELFRAVQQHNPQFQLQNSEFKMALETLIEKEFVVRDPVQKQRFVYEA